MSVPKRAGRERHPNALLQQTKIMCACSEWTCTRQELLPEEMPFSLDANPRLPICWVGVGSKSGIDWASAGSDDCRDGYLGAPACRPGLGMRCGSGGQAVGRL